MEKSAYSEDPYQDGTVPADADLSTSSTDGAAEETTGHEVSGATGSGDPDPDSLVEGNRVATAADME